MLGVISFIVIISISLLITRIATIALVATGLSEEAARFQARSAFSGVGYTTSESEKIVNHPIRRKILMFLMLIGNAGIVTSVTTLILAFVSKENIALLPRLIVLTFGLLIIWYISTTRWFNKYSSKIIDKLLRKYTDLDVRDYSSLLHLSGEYQVVELLVEHEDWLAGKTLKELKLLSEGILVLSIERGKEFWGVPAIDITILPNDLLILYGRASSLKALDNRKAGELGDKEHYQSKRVQDKLTDQQLDMILSDNFKNKIQ